MTPKNKVVDQNETMELEARNMELKDRLARSLADYSNLEKRIENQRQLYVTLATVSIVSKMIDVLDDLYLTYTHLQDPGLKMTIGKFVNILQSEGMEEINCQGQEFDPANMECIDMVEGEEDKVITVAKRGYSLNGQVIRPAQVVVGKKIEN